MRRLTLALRVADGGALLSRVAAVVNLAPGAIARPNSGFLPVYRGTRWSVWTHVR